MRDPFNPLKMPPSLKVFQRFFKATLINQNHLNHSSAYYVYNFLSFKSWWFRFDPKRRGTPHGNKEKKVGVAGWNSGIEPYNLNVNLNRSFVITFGVFTASSLTDRQQIILQLN